MPIKITLPQFIDRATNTHKGKYDYSLVDYVNRTTNVTIICPIHGEFKQKAGEHLNGHGCNLCGYITSKKAITSNLQEFIAKGVCVHENKYDYSLVVYKTSKIKVSIICPIHGVFLQTPNHHLRGHGCPKCSRLGYSRTTWNTYCDNKMSSEPKVYIVRCYNNTEEFIKIGITTNSVYKRFANKIPYDYEILKEIKGSPDFVWNKEKELHKLYKEFKYSPLIPFKGHTECFNLTIKDRLIP